MAKVSFNGTDKLIVVTEVPNVSGEITLDAQIDIYSDWKEWVLTAENTKYLEAIRTTAGDPISEESIISPYFFLLNGWRIRPYEETHRMILEGNLFLDGGGNPFIPTLGPYNVIAELRTTVNAVTTVVSASGAAPDAVANAVWDKMAVEHLTPGTMGYLINDIANNVDDLYTARIVAKGTVGPGSTFDMVTTNLTQPNNFYDGMDILVFGSGGTSVRRMTEYTNALGACYVDTSLPFIPQQFDVFIILGSHKSQDGSIE